MERDKIKGKQPLRRFLSVFLCGVFLCFLSSSVYGFYDEEDDEISFFDEIIQESEERKQGVIQSKEPSLTSIPDPQLPSISPSTPVFSVHQIEQVNSQHDDAKNDVQMFSEIKEESGVRATVLRSSYVSPKAKIVLYNGAIGQIKEGDLVKALAFSNDGHWLKISSTNRHDGEKVIGWIRDDRVEVHGVYGPSEITLEQRQKLDRKTKNRRWTIAQTAKKSLPREYGREKKPNCLRKPPASRKAGEPKQLKEAPHRVTVYDGSYITEDYGTTCEKIIELSPGERFIYLGWHNSASYVGVLKKSGRMNYGWIQERGVSKWKKIFNVPDDAPEFWKKAIEEFPIKSQHVVTKDTGFVLRKGKMAHLDQRGVLPKGTVVNKYAEHNNIVLVSFKYPGQGNFYTWFHKEKFLKLGQWQANVAAKTEERKGLSLWIVIGSIIYFILVLGTRIGRYVIDWFGYFIFKEGRSWKFIIMGLSMLFLWITVLRLYRGVAWEEGVTATDSTSMFTALSVPLILLLPFFFYITWIWVKMLFTPLVAEIQADKVMEHGADAAYASQIFDESEDGKYWADKAKQHHATTVAAVFKTRKLSFRQSMQDIEDKHREQWRKKS